jgi:demethylmenaquinone methyltransferase/2-methoxy-6-polyprenyl-1,4-benzoquinol methylase
MRHAPTGGGGRGDGDRWFFDLVAPVYDLGMPETDRGSLDAAFALADGSVETVLDVGGGTGRAAKALGDRRPVVVDASLPMLRRAHGRGFDAVLGDAGRLPVRGGRADAVVVLDALHHFPDRVGAVEAAARALRPGGVLVLRDFDPTTLRGRALAAVEHLVGFDSVFLDPARARDLLAAAGLDGRVVESGFAYTVAGVRREPGDR